MPARVFKSDFGEAFPGLAGHDFVFAFGDAGQARRTPIQGKAHGIEDGRLARTRGAGDDENAVRQKSRVRKIDGPFPDKELRFLKRIWRMRMVFPLGVRVFFEK